MECSDIGALIELLKQDESVKEHVIKHKYFFEQKTGKEAGWEQVWYDFVETEFFQKELFPKVQEKY